MTNVEQIGKTKKTRDEGWFGSTKKDSIPLDPCSV